MAALALRRRTPATRPGAGPRDAGRAPRTRRRPPSSIACTMARSRWVRSAAINPASSSGSRMRGSRRTARTSGWPRPSRRRRVGSPRGTGLVSTPTSPRVIKIAVEGGHRSQSTPNRGARQPRTAIGDPHHVLGAHPGPALRVHEAEHVHGPDLAGILGDDGEERLQVVRIGPHRVGPGPTRRELQELVDERMPDDIDVSAVALPGDTANQRRPDHRHRTRSARG